MLDHLTVQTANPDSKLDILSEWSWLLGAEKRAVLLTAAGDAFVQDAGDGAIYFLNVSAGQVFRIADNAAAFEQRLGDPAFVEEFLCPYFVAHLRERGMLLKRGDIYSYRVPLSLGGEVSADNVDITDAEVHFSIAGQVARQIADLPDGTPITNIAIRMPGKKPWWKFW